MEIRTRFAPSPTGFLHIGGLRTALYNYLFTKKNSGKFILRIEDTDQNRLISNATQNLISTLKKCGLEYDEGPDINGEYGPYIQSERLDIYNKYLMQLIHEGIAYPCFFTSEKPDELYPDYNITNALEKMNHEQYVVKFKTQSNESLHTYDQIRGKITFDLNLVEDPIIFKSDGYPTYHFANVIDDHLMKISHVIRGEEWLPSLPKHVRLYEAFGWDLPKFCHLPLLLNPDKSKLSKRQGDVAVEDFLDKGYIKESIINFVALLGWHPSNDQEIFDFKNLISEFSLKRVNKSGAVFDINKLNWMNKLYLQNTSVEKIYESISAQLKKQNINIEDVNTVHEMIKFAKPRSHTMNDVVRVIVQLLEYNPPNKNILNQYEYYELGSLWVQELSIEKILNESIIQNIIELSKKKLNLSGKNLFIPLRLMLIGKEHGPDLYTLINILGPKESILRINNFINQ